MRPIVKGQEPATVTETRTATTTDLSTPTRARTAFDQIDKKVARADLAREQGWLCAFCMRRVDPEAKDARGEPTRQRSGGRQWSCDAAQGSKALTIDPKLR